MMRVDFNCDLGEGEGLSKSDASVLPLVTSANIACGFHAGGPSTMRATVIAARDAGVAVGAHPSFYDREGFGRRELNLRYDEAADQLLYQLGALQAFCRGVGLNLRHVKPHGALYNMAARDERLARAVCTAVRDFDDSLILLGLSNSAMLVEAERLGLRTASEVFADRGYCDDGSLVSRSAPGAVITDADAVVKRVLRMVTDGTVESVTGRVVRVRADSICLHGDNPEAVALAKAIRGALVSAGVALKPFGEA